LGFATRPPINVKGPLQWSLELKCSIVSTKVNTSTLPEYKGKITSKPSSERTDGRYKVRYVAQKFFAVYNDKIVTVV
jgi:hypothetical protein